MQNKNRREKKKKKKRQLQWWEKQLVLGIRKAARTATERADRTEGWHRVQRSGGETWGLKIELMNAKELSGISHLIKKATRLARSRNERS